MKLYLEELLNLNIGYSFDEKRICLMWEIAMAMDFIQNGNPTSSEFFKIIAFYE